MIELGSFNDDTGHPARYLFYFSRSEKTCMVSDCKNLGRFKMSWESKCNNDNSLCLPHIIADRASVLPAHRANGAKDYVEGNEKLLGILQQFARDNYEMFADELL